MRPECVFQPCGASNQGSNSLRWCLISAVLQSLSQWNVVCTCYTLSAQMETALASFLTPKRPMSRQVLNSYRDLISHLTRRMFHLLLRYMHACIRMCMKVLLYLYKHRVFLSKRPWALETHGPKTGMGSYMEKPFVCITLYTLQKTD